MPLFLDVHEIDGGISVEDVAAAHARDVEEQERHGVVYRRYWVDERRGRFFCLVEAPSVEAAAMVHRESHGLLAAKIYEVQEGS